MQKTIVRRKKLTQLQPDPTLNQLIQTIYENRGIENLNQVDHGLKILQPFDSLKGIDEAVALLYQHLNRQSNFLVIGDFDADGATSSALAVSALKTFGAKHVDFLVPNRFEFGYGLTPAIVEVAKTRKPNLLITVDNGIASLEGVEAAKAAGIEVLVTDHHLPGQSLPRADAIVNPNQPGCKFPSKNLAGVGVIFYVMLALRRHLVQHQWFEAQQIAPPNMGQFLDLVALGTVADVVPLDQNNRILVKQGLNRIRQGHCRVGIKALLEISKRNQAKLLASDLGFALGPRLNAAGRLDDMSIGIECLLTEDAQKAQMLALTLNDLNQERKSIETDMQQQALSALQGLSFSKKLPTGLCLFDENWHQGVIGILASRIKDKYHRPVIAFAPGDNGLIKGSARSLPGLHIRDVLDTIATQNPGLISKFGGHAMAAGLSLPLENYQHFSQAFNHSVKKLLSEEALQKQILSDGMLNTDDFTIDTVQLIQNAGPFGQNFPEPVFDGVFTLISQRIVGGHHLKLVLGLEDFLQVDAIAFNVDLDKWPNHRCEKVQLAYKLDINEYMGRQNLQLIVDHIEALVQP